MHDSELDARLRRAGQQWRSGQPGWAEQPTGDPLTGTDDVAYRQLPSQPGVDHRRRLPTVIAAGIAAVVALGCIGLVIDRAATRTDRGAPAASGVSVSASHSSSASPLPVHGTTIPPGTGPFISPAGLVSGRRLIAPSVAHGPHGFLVIALEGSSSCPEIGTAARLTGHQQVAIDTRQLLPSTSEGLCTADLSPHLTTLPLPAGVDESQTLRIAIEGFTIDLPPR